MKRERLEDIGRIYIMLGSIVNDDYSPFYECSSKHSIDAFLEKYKDPEKLEDLHDWLRWKGEKLKEVLYLAEGYDE